jgi:predicted MFS family arabinose efflux permease
MAFGSLAFLSRRLWHFYLVFLLLGLVGNGTTQLGYSRPVATWFITRRGMALSWIAAGAGLGAMTLPLIAAALLSRNGWRFAYGFLGALVLVVSLPLTALFVCESSSGGAANAFEPSVRRLTAHSMRAKPFLLLIAAIFLYSVTFSALLSHLSAILTVRGMSLRSSAQVLSILGGCSFAGRVSIGFILDRASATRISFVLFVTTVFGVFLLSDAGTAGAFLGVSLIGLAAGGESDITPYLLSRYFGLRNLSTLYGFAWTAFAAGAATGAVLMGKLYATTGSYRPGGIRWFAIPTAISALLMAVMPRYPSSGGDSHTTETQQSKMLDRT